MATLTKAINKSLFDSILPTFGNPRVHVPVWDEGQKMFICNEYESSRPGLPLAPFSPPGRH